MTTLFSKIKEVTELSAISGHEAPVRSYLREKITPHVDEVVTDGLGGIFGVRHAEVENAPRVLVAAHMDEVGFMVSEIKPEFINPTTSTPYGDPKYSVFLVFVYAMLFTTVLPYMSVRFLAMKTDMNIPLVALYMAPMGFAMSFVPLVGIYMFYKDPTWPQVLAVEAPATAHVADHAMPVFLHTYLSPTVASIISLFIIFAMLSTISSVLQVQASAPSPRLQRGQGTPSSSILRRMPSLSWAKARAWAPGLTGTMRSAARRTASGTCSCSTVRTSTCLAKSSTAPTSEACPTRECGTAWPADPSAASTKARKSIPRGIAASCIMRASWPPPTTPTRGAASAAPVPTTL